MPLTLVVLHYMGILNMAKSKEPKTAEEFYEQNKEACDTNAATLKVTPMQFAKSVFIDKSKS